MNTIAKTQRHKQLGLTLIEASFVLGLSAIVLGGAMYLYRSNTSDANTDRQVQGVLDFMSKSTQTFGLAGGNWDNFTAAKLIQMERIPPQFSKDASKIYDAFRNEVVFGTPSITEGVVRFTLRSPEECTKLTQAVAEVAYATAVGTSGSETVVKTGTTKMDMSALGTGCAATNPVLKVTLR